MGRAMNRVGMLQGLGLGGLVLLPVVALEIGLAVPLRAWAYLLYGGFGGLLLTLLALRRSRRWAGWALPVLLLGLTVLHAGQWTSRKVFLQQLERVELGMEVARVEFILSAYPPIITHEGAGEVRAYRHSLVGRFDSDVGLVRVESGRVTAVEFLPD